MAQTIVERRPGRRVQGYRNSRPRLVKVIGLGAAAVALAEDLAAAAPGGNVLLGRALSAAAPEPIDAPVGGVAPGAVILVLHALEPPSELPFRLERTAATLSVVMLEPPGTPPAVGPALAAANRIRKVADMFASTSDPDFVRDLVSNLAS